MMPKEPPVRYAAERLALRLLWTGLAVLFLIVVIPQLWRLFSPFIIALPIGIALQPSIRFFQEKLHLKRGIAVAFWVLLVCSVAFILLYWFVSFLVVQIISASNNAPAIVQSVVGMLQAAANRILDMAQSMPASIGETIRTSLDSAFRSFSDAGLSMASNLVGVVLAFAASLPYAFVYGNFLVLGLFFLTGRIPAIQAYIHQLRGRSSGNASEKNSGESLSMLRQSAIGGMVGYVRVQFLFFLLTFLLSWVYFQFLNFDYAMLIGLAAAFLELIPQFGCGTLYIPWCAMCFLTGANENGWLILGLYLGYCLLRRLTEPTLLGNNLGVSPLLSLIGMFVGMQLAGIPGLIAGPIAMVVLASAIRARLFVGIYTDCQIVSRYMKARWKRGRKEFPHTNL